METYNTCMSLPFPYMHTSTTTPLSTIPSGISVISHNPNGVVVNTTTSTPWMDSRIWSRLPHHLLHRVLAFLPPPAFFRFRCVSKRWYGLLYSPSFLQIYLQVSPRCRYWFLFFYHHTLKSSICRMIATGDNARTPSEAYLFDPYELKWYCLTFLMIMPGFSPTSASGGLVCWISDEAGPKGVFLHNPIVGTMTRVPPTFRPRLFPTVGLSITNSTIDMTLAGDDLISPYAVKNLTTESFHVDSRGFYSIWATTSALPRLCSPESGQMVSVQGKFYCMNYNPFGVLAFDISSNTWSKIQAPMRRFLRSPSLVESKGRLIMVAAVEKSKLSVPRSLRMWSLQPRGTQWLEIARMPQPLYSQLFPRSLSPLCFTCVAHGQFVVVLLNNNATGNNNKGVLFDMDTNMWVSMPPCPGGSSGCGGGGGGGGGLHGFAYEPKLATPMTALLDQLALPLQPF